MSATILTATDEAQFWWMVFLILALIPFLAGVLVRILVAKSFVAGVLGVASGLVLSAIKLGRIGFQWDQPSVDTIPVIIFFVVIVAGFSTAGVLSVSAFYSGYRRVTETNGTTRRRS